MKTFFDAALLANKLFDFTERALALMFVTFIFGVNISGILTTEILTCTDSNISYRSTLEC